MQLLQIETAPLLKGILRHVVDVLQARCGALHLEAHPHNHFTRHRYFNNIDTVSQLQNTQ